MLRPPQPIRALQQLVRWCPAVRNRQHDRAALLPARARDGHAAELRDHPDAPADRGAALPDHADASADRGAALRDHADAPADDICELQRHADGPADDTCELRDHATNMRDHATNMRDDSDELRDHAGEPRPMAARRQSRHAPGSGSARAARQAACGRVP